MHSTSSLSRRERLRETTIEEIKEAARQQMAEQGAAALSLGAIARAMGMTTPALYRYFENRDALVTALIIDAYHSLADTLEDALAPLPATDYALRLQTLLLSYRLWALQHPQDYTLCHGAPLAGYEGAADAIRPAALRTLKIIGFLLTEADAASPLHLPPSYFQPPAPVRETLEALQGVFPERDIPIPLLTFTIMTWIQVHGLIWQELSGHLPARLLQGGALYQMEVQLICQRLGLALP
ncbi:MAG: TetR/AcrR family transcriptional regulator [Ardenticatenales bacterium]|nr:TetR/AcrR family transcriptional regulator [Ardenticatenales bacterium]